MTAPLNHRSVKVPDHVYNRVDGHTSVDFVGRVVNPLSVEKRLTLDRVDQESTVGQTVGRQSVDTSAVCSVDTAAVKRYKRNIGKVSRNVGMTAVNCLNPGVMFCSTSIMIIRTSKCKYEELFPTTDLPGGGRVLLGIFGRGVPPGSPNPDPISDQNMSFSTPVFRPGL